VVEAPLSAASDLSMVKLLLDKGAKLKNEIVWTIGNFEIFKYLLKRAANPKATDKYGNTLLHEQCERGHLKNAKYLIEHYNADVNAKNDAGLTPLHLACKGNIFPLYKKSSLKIVKFLIEEQTADPEVTCNEGKTALHHAAKNYHPSILRYLIEDQKLDIEATDNEGRTALHLACQTDIFFEDKWETQKYLIEDHAKITEAKDKKGKTALHYCLEHFEKESEHSFEYFKPIALILATKAKIVELRVSQEIDPIFDWMKQSYDKDMKKSTGEDEAVSCLYSGIQKFQKNLDKKDKTLMEYNPLLYIVDYCNRVDIAEYMFNQDLCYIENHFNAEEANSRRDLLLKSYLKFSCENGLLDLIRFLFQEINNKQEFFEHLHFDGSFLETACENNHIDIFKYLLEDEKAKDEAAEFLKDFPLHFACKYGSVYMVQYLIETKLINIEVKDKAGSTPLHLTCFEGSIQIAEYLIEKQNANIDTTDNEGRSVWHFACKSRCFELVKYIFQKTKQDVNAQDEYGSTALHLACGRYKPSLKVVKYLINDMKANLHSVDNEGRTPLHVAWNAPISKFLVSKGANVLAKDKNGKNPLQIARGIVIPFLKAATKR
jgi:ankyrin repeat protein